MKDLKMFLVVAILFSACAALERDLLLDIYHNTGGEAWRNNTGWADTNQNECLFYGVTCDSDGNITSLDLSSNLLSGSIPAGLDQLTHLVHLNLSNNAGLTGDLPDLSNLTSLKSIDLSHTQLTNPTEWLKRAAAFGSLAQLEVLNLHGTQMWSDYPSGFLEMKNLTVFDIGGSKLSGDINSLAQMINSITKLILLDLSDNNFDTSNYFVFPAQSPDIEYIDTGSISLFQQRTAKIPDVPLRKLKQLRMPQKRLTGSIPDVFGQIEYVNLESNSLTGDIPPSLYNSPSLVHIDLSGNSFATNLPNLTSVDLNYIDMSSNSFRGPLPRGWANLTRLTYFDVSNNNLNGELVGIFDGMISLDTINVQFNSFSGMIPDLFKHVKRFLGNNNQLEGNLPSSLLQSDSLVEIRLSRNFLSGNLPTESSGLNNLTILDLSRNMLTGSIPSWISQKTNLQSILLQQNQLSGTIPSSLGNLYNLETLKLGSNQLTGSIPLELSNLTLLTTLSVPSNGLTGGVPAIFNQLSLNTLDVSYNTQLGGTLDFLVNVTSLYDFYGSHCSFTGNIPEHIGGDLLFTFDVGYNQLGGDLPYLPAQTDLILTHNNFTGPIPSPGPGMNVFDLSYNRFNGCLDSKYYWGLTMDRILLNNNELTNCGPGIYDHNLNLFAEQQFMTLNTLDLSNNRFFGEFTRATFSGLSGITEFRLAGNSFSGQFPIEFGGANLRIFDISRNSFTGYIPLTSGQQTSLSIEVINVSHNQMRDVFPSSLSSLPLVSLDLSHNLLIGTIPSAIAQFTTLTEIAVQGNMFQGDIPQEIGQLRQLLSVNMSQNGLTATSLDFVCSLVNLQSLDLSENKIQAMIPSVLAPTITALDLSNNEIYGQIPDSVFNLRALTQLSLGNNSLEGQMRDLLGDPKIFDVSHNRLTGDVSFLSQMSSISDLRLNNNQFSGSLPSLTSRKNLLYVDVSANELSGQLSDFTQLLSLQYLDLSRNRFNGSIPSFSGSQSIARLDLSHNLIQYGRQTVCSVDDNPLRCPVDWTILSQCRGSCEAVGNNTVQSVDFHMQGEVSTFDSAAFLRTLSRLGNITQSRLSISSLRSGSVIATVDVQPSAAGQANEGSVEDTVQVLKSIPMTSYGEAGYNLIDPVGSTASVAPVKGSSSNTGIIVGVVVGFTALIVIVVVAFLLYRKQMSKRVGNNQFAMIDVSQLNTSTVKKSLIDFDELKNMQMIGSGAFGIVYKARWRETAVAVKQIRAEYVTEGQLKDFLREVAILQGLKSHPNIVMFIGMTFPPQPLSLVTEFCGGGGLFDYLRQNECTIDQKVKFMLEIALGMLHLHKEKVIHRDLAVRNILLNSHLEAKVADFGLSREQHDTAVASQTQTSVGPLKWMAPEAIQNRVYSVKSDAFSFGVVMWEILEVSEPWADVDPVNAAVRIVTKGERLPIPNDCPLPVSELMTDPVDRPDFELISASLRAEEEEGKEQVVVRHQPEQYNTRQYSTTVQTFQDAEHQYQPVAPRPRTAPDAHTNESPKTIDDDVI
ncbi:hypothetical protein PROFUN_09504 [Planoprotostelium fungivorum]|uniref:Protein kinase domain-containing protein n=1 Tax=Planoprotostelium fungivorum TaxID=1890364 RepID=A0A2P6NH86_9EUKA|nr:hypothetical protein PROFUN_09504 [Planoprotostelium fungivorum]